MASEYLPVGHRSGFGQCDAGLCEITDYMSTHAAHPAVRARTHGKFTTSAGNHSLRSSLPYPQRHPKSSPGQAPRNSFHYSTILLKVNNEGIISDAIGIHHSGEYNHHLLGLIAFNPWLDVGLLTVESGGLGPCGLLVVGCDQVVL